MKEERSEIVIVGFGLLGNIAALLYAHLGFSVVVIEKKGLDDILLAKSARIDEDIMLLFEQLGLIDELMPILNPLTGTQIVDKKGRVLLEFNEKNKSQFAPFWGFYQPELQRILQNKALRNPKIKILSQTEVETFEQNEDVVEVYYAISGKQDFKKIIASYLLVCNGQYSNVADFLDLDFDDYNYYSSVLCVDTKSKENKKTARFAQTICDVEFPVVRINNNTCQRWEFQIDSEKINEKNSSAKIKNLLDELGEEDLEIVSAFVYSFESRILNKWRADRVLIAGDASHVMPPYLGMGLSAGIKDIYNLAWKVKLVEDSVVDAGVLDSYQLEREDNVRYLIKLSLWIKRLFNSSKLRWIKGFIPVIPKWFLKRTLDTSNLIKKGIIGALKKGGGQMMISPKVVNDKGETIHLNKLLEPTFVLLALDENPVDVLSPFTIERIAGLNVQFIHVSSKKTKFVKDGRYAQNIWDRDGKLEEWFLFNKSKYLLLRPDRIVYQFYTNQKEINLGMKELRKKLFML